jgi:nucleoid DNA-binding protein
MDNIHNYIYNLLHKHDCVVLPTFGGFVTSYNSAYINTANGLVVPPYKNIIFNKKLVHNDGLLAHYIVEQNQCSINDANIAINNFVAHITAELNNNKRTEIGQLGVFYINAENNILFRQSKLQDFSIASYGLPSFTVNKLLLPITTNNIVPLSTTTQQVTLQPNAVANKFNYKRIAVAAVTIPAIIGLIWASYSLSQPNNIHIAGFSTSTQSTAVTPPALYDRAYFEGRMNKAEKNITQCKHTIDSLTQVIAVRTNIQTQIDTTRVATVSQRIINEISFTKYYLIAGCFSNVENATKFVAELKQNGNANALVLDGNINGLTRVAYGVYTSKTDAQQAKQQVASANNGAWIYKASN